MELPKKIQYDHLPVLRDEVVAEFAAYDVPDAFVIDGTLGLGGHSQALLERYSHLSVLGVEWDAQALQVARDRLEPRFGSRFVGLQGSYTDLKPVLEKFGLQHVSGVLLDLGVSSLQLDDPARGFSFSKRGPLDMRMSQTLPLTAWDLLNDSDEHELARLFKEYGEEPQARTVAKTLKDAIGRGQLINDSWSVAQCMRGALPISRGRIDPATRCFQALRMAVNHELENIGTFLEQLPSLLSRGGRAVVLSFHSLEDRLVKQTFVQAAKGCICPPRVPQCVCGKLPWARLRTRKAIQASEAEKEANPRSRSVRMRVIEKL